MKFQIVLHDVGQLFLSHDLVHERNLFWELSVHKDSTWGGKCNFAIVESDHSPISPFETSGFHRIDRVSLRREPLNGLCIFWFWCEFHCEIEDTPSNIFSRGGNWSTVGWLKKVLGRKHDLSCFGSCFLCQWNVHCHLVSVKVRVVRVTNERVKLNSLTFDQRWTEGLDTKTVKGWSTVQQNKCVLN